MEEVRVTYELLKYNIPLQLIAKVIEIVKYDETLENDRNCKIARWHKYGMEVYVKKMCMICLKLFGYSRECTFGDMYCFEHCFECELLICRDCSEKKHCWNCKTECRLLCTECHTNDPFLCYECNDNLNLENSEK